MSQFMVNAVGVGAVSEHRYEANLRLAERGHDTRDLQERPVTVRRLSVRLAGVTARVVRVF